MGGGVYSAVGELLGRPRRVRRRPRRLQPRRQARHHRGQHPDLRRPHLSGQRRRHLRARAELHHRHGGHPDRPWATSTATATWTSSSAGEHHVASCSATPTAPSRAPALYPGLAGQNDIQAADFNGDGNLDLVESNGLRSNSGRGDGSFYAVNDERGRRRHHRFGRRLQRRRLAGRGLHEPGDVERDGPHQRRQRRLAARRGGRPGRSARPTSSTAGVALLRDRHRGRRQRQRRRRTSWGPSGSRTPRPVTPPRRSPTRSRPPTPARTPS